MADIFICYRRTDSEGYAGRLHDHLQDRFGARAVFVDVDNLHPGVDFEQVIQRTLLRSSIVLVVIGPRWLDQRLKNEQDYVRREISAALKGKKRLIPILVGEAKMPGRDKLPPELAALAGKNGVTLRHSTWKADVARLVSSLDRILARKKATAQTGSGAVKQTKPIQARRGEGKKADTGASGQSPMPPKTKAQPKSTGAIAAKRPRPTKTAAEPKPEQARSGGKRPRAQKQDGGSSSPRNAPRRSSAATSQRTPSKQSAKPGSKRKVSPSPSAPKP